MKKINTIPFDRYRIPPKQNLFIMPLLWLYCFFMTRKGKLQIQKVRMQGLKPPYLVLGTHHAYSDFYVTPLALFPHRANYISELEGFEAFGEWFYRQLGCLGTRKFVTDLALIKNIERVIKRKGILAYYPEARYANAGTNSHLPPSVGKLIKLLGVPVVTLNMKGNYLQSPIWNLAIRKEVRQMATLTQALTADEVAALSVDEINARIGEYLRYDEYAYQFETKTAIMYEKRAEGLEKVLYQCPVCKKEFSMQSKNETLFCSSCGEKRYLSAYGRLEKTPNPYSVQESSNVCTRIPDWYEWERKQVEAEIENGTYHLTVPVHIESLPNAVNFIDLGEGILHHDEKGFELTFTEYGSTAEHTHFFASGTLFSIHTEYDYRGKGQCVTLSTVDSTYFIFPRGEGFNATKIQFATEYLYKKAHTDRC